MDTFVVFFSLLFQNPTITAAEIEQATVQSQSAAYFIKRGSVPIAKEVLRCFYPDARLIRSSITQRPWDRAAEFEARESVVFHVDYQDSRRLMGKMDVVLLTGKGKGEWARVLTDSTIKKDSECQLRNQKDQDPVLAPPRE